MTGEKMDDIDKNLSTIKNREKKNDIKNVNTKKEKRKR